MTWAESSSSWQSLKAHFARAQCQDGAQMSPIFTQVLASPLASAPNEVSDVEMVSA